MNMIEFTNNVQTIIDNNNKKWFCAMHIGKLLQHSNVRMLVKRAVEPEDKRIFFAKTFVNYCGLLSMAFRSKTARSKALQKFVAKMFEEVMEKGSFSLDNNMCHRNLKDNSLLKELAPRNDFSSYLPIGTINLSTGKFEVSKNMTQEEIENNIVQQRALANQLLQQIERIRNNEI